MTLFYKKLLNWTSFFLDYWCIFYYNVRDDVLFISIMHYPYDMIIVLLFIFLYIFLNRYLENYIDFHFLWLIFAYLLVLFIFFNIDMSRTNVNSCDKTFIIGDNWIFISFIAISVTEGAFTFSSFFVFI